MSKPTVIFDRVDRAFTVDFSEVRRRSLDGSRHFFDASSTRFFNSKYPRQGYATDDNRFFFVTSEQFDYHSPRLYTVRYMDLAGNIETVNLDGTCGTCPKELDGFQAFENSELATRAARAFAKSNHTPVRAWHYNGSELVRTPLELTHDGA